MPDILNELTRKYLNENGIKITFLTEYLGVDYAIVNKWLYGKGKNKKQKRVFIFCIDIKTL